MGRIVTVSDSAGRSVTVPNGGVAQTSRHRSFRRPQGEVCGPQHIQTKPIVAARKTDYYLAGLGRQGPTNIARGLCTIAIRAIMDARGRLKPLRAETRCQGRL
jgi:hypothetical protein